MSTKEKPGLIALISGKGRTLANLIDRYKQGKLLVPVQLVISSNTEAYGITIAKSNNISFEIVPRKSFTDDREFSGNITQIIEKREFKLIVLCGFVHLYLFPEKWLGKVLNIHPALLPKFGGKGYYGIKVHKAVIKSADTVSGPTVHYANLEYDRGPIILQSQVPVLRTDTPEILQERVFQEECVIYPKAINMVLEGKVPFK